MKHFLFLLAILLFFESHAQTRSLKIKHKCPVMSWVICTHHRNELAARGFTNIFERNGKYCAVITDNSMEVLNDIAEWIKAGLMVLISPNEIDELEEWTLKREREKEQGLLDELYNWDNYGAGKGQRSVAVKSKEESWLDKMFDFWNLD